MQLLKVSLTLRMTLIQKGEFVSFKVTPLPLMTKFSVFMPLQDIAPGNSWLGGISLNGYKITWKIKVREMKTK